MEHLNLLLSRKSHNQLIQPAPTKEQLTVLFKAALRAPDHALLKPWRYRVFEGDALLSLGNKMVESALKLEPGLSTEKIEKIRLKPQRAPMVIVASVVIQTHPKVPEIEQILSGGASVQNLLMAAHFQGIGAMWRTGSMTFNPHLMSLLKFEPEEILIGFIYLGQEKGEKRPAKMLDMNDFVTRCD